MAQDSLLNVLMLFVFSILAGTVRFINKELNQFTFKGLLINGVTALLSGMLIYFFTIDLAYIIEHPGIQAGLIGLAGYMAPETLKFFSNKYLDKLDNEK